MDLPKLGPEASLTDEQIRAMSAWGTGWMLCPSCHGLGKVPDEAALRRFEQITTLIDWLDAVGVPIDWGKLRVTRVLRDNRVAVRAETIVAAVRIRRERHAARIKNDDNE